MKKVFIILAVIAATIIGGQNAISSTGDEVQLIRVQSTSQMGSYAYIDRAIEIKVKNIAYEKAVAVHHQNADGTWYDISASYTSSLPNNFEIWTAKIKSPSGALGTKFAIKYTVNGNTYWDNNNGSDYDVNLACGVYLNNNYNVLSRGARFNSDYSLQFAGTIDVRNLAYVKDVTVVYSYDNWTTTKTVKATFVDDYSWGYTYVQSPNEYGIERWDFTADAKNAGSVVYAISYTVNGVTYWDNNFGQNYTLPE